ncbi:MAG: hypothetical protein RR348_05955 [Clostridia bacterium]
MNTQVALSSFQLAPQVIFAKSASKHSKFICVRVVQFLNALPPIDVTLSGIIIDARLEQLKNAFVSIVVRAVGIVTLARLEQFKNAFEPIEVIDDGKIIVDSEEQY